MVRELVPAALVVGALTLVAKSLAAGRELLVAFHLGTSPQLDAFLFAYMFPAFLINVVSASLQSALVPRLLLARAAGDVDRVCRLAGESATLVTVASIAIAFVAAPLAALAMPLVAHGFADSTLALSRQLVFLLMPLLALSGLASFWTGILNAERRFALAAAVPAITPIVVVACLWFGWGPLGLYSLVLGTLAGALLELTIVAVAVRRLDVPLFHRLRSVSEDQRAMFGQFWPAALANVLMAGTMVIDQSTASSLAPGSVAALSYGTRLTGVASSVVVMAVSTVTLPFFSTLVANRDWHGLRRSLRQSALLVVGVGGALAAVFVAGSHDITALFYERGRFTATDTELVAGIQALHALQIPIFGLSMVAVRLVSALAATRILLIGAALNLATDWLVNLYAPPLLGVRGVALANIAMYTVSCLFLWGAAVRELRRRSRATP